MEILSEKPVFKGKNFKYQFQQSLNQWQFLERTKKTTIIEEITTNRKVKIIYDKVIDFLYFTWHHNIRLILVLLLLK